MKKEFKLFGTISLSLFALFIILLLLVCFVDVEAIGPLGSEIGLSTLNAAMKDLIGESEILYSLSELTIYLAILVAAAFCTLGVIELIKRKKLFGVDKEILWLGVIYALAIIFYVLFEILVVNYRPVLIEGELEAAFPSSHTMLVSTILITAIPAFYRLVAVRWARILVLCSATAITAFTIVARLLSGVHWFTDIIGGLLLSLVLVTLYIALINYEVKEKI